MPPNFLLACSESRRLSAQQSGRAAIRSKQSGTAAKRSKRQKILQKHFAVVRHYRFGVKLNTLADEPSVTNTHHDTVWRSRRNFEFGRNRIPVDYERMIAGSAETVFYPS